MLRDFIHFILQAKLIISLYLCLYTNRGVALVL